MLAAVIVKAMAKNPADRYATATRLVCLGILRLLICDDDDQVVRAELSQSVPAAGTSQDRSTRAYNGPRAV